MAASSTTTLLGSVAGIHSAGINISYKFLKLDLHTVYTYLSKGNFVRYYGGCQLLKDVAITGSPVGPLFIAGCALFQFSILIFKKIKMRKLNPRSRSPGNYNHIS